MHNVHVNEGSDITMRRGEGGLVLLKIFSEEKCLEFAFEGRESS